MKKLIAGLDEVGMGCLAGPLVVVVTAFDQKKDPLEGVTDSKALTPKKREELVPVITKYADYLGFGWADNEFIDKYGISMAWQHAAAQAVGTWKFHELMVDGDRRVDNYPRRQNTYRKGDARFWQIGAASIVAKVFRDREMVRYHNENPLWGWNGNAGYGTRSHYEAVFANGLSRWHRRSFFMSKKFKAQLRERDKFDIHPSLEEFR